MNLASHPSIFIFFAYGVLVLLGIVLIFSLGVIVYNLISVRRQQTISGRRQELKDAIEAYLVGAISKDNLKKVLLTRQQYLIGVVAQIAQLADSQVRSKLIKIFPTCQCEWMLEQELQKISSTNWHTRRNAASYLPFIAPAEAIEPALLKCLEDEMLDVRFVAAEALSEIQDSSAIKSILHSLALPGSWPLQRLCELMSHFDDRSIPYLLEYLDDPGASAAGRQIAIVSLGKKKAKAALPALLKFATDGDIEVQIEAYRALGEVGDASSLEALLLGLSHSEWEVRVVCAKALKPYLSEVVVARLRSGLADSVWWVRFNCATTLLSMGSLGRLALEGALSDSDRFAREMSQMILDGANHHSLVDVQGKR